MRVNVFVGPSRSKAIVLVSLRYSAPDPPTLGQCGNVSWRKGFGVPVTAVPHLGLVASDDHIKLERTYREHNAKTAFKVAPSEK